MIWEVATFDYKRARLIISIIINRISNQQDVLSTEHRGRRRLWFIKSKIGALYRNRVAFK